MHSFHYRAALLPFLLMLLLHAQAQRPGGAPSMGRIYGKVLDSATKKPAEFATVSVKIARNDSLIGGTIVRPNGDFSVEELPLTSLKITISFIGYTPTEKEIVLSRDRAEQDLGNIMLSPDAELLKEVEVVGERATMVMQVDRRVFNVEKDLSVVGGSGVDVMKNVPGLSVDVEGNVQMRGSSPLILVDGRPTSLTLEQIPAEEIERVEVITNPSVAFDANTTGGIINVVLKKNTKPGYSGQLQAGIGSNDRYQGGLNLNAKEGRWGFNLSYNYNTSSNNTDGLTHRTDRLTGEYFDQGSDSKSTRTMHGGRLGLDYQLNNRNSISISQGFRVHDMGGSDVQQYTVEGPGGELIEYGSQFNTQNSFTNSLTSQIAFRRKSPKEGKEWSADVTYNRWMRDSRSDLDQYSFHPNGSDMEGTPRLQDNIGGSTYDEITFQSDHVDPVNDRTKLEWGVKGQYKLDNTFINVYLTTPAIGENVLDTSLTNDYAITDIINAAYFNWSRKLSDKWSVQAGLRFEQTWFVTELRGKDQTFSYKYPDGLENIERAIYPALYFSRKWADSTRELQLNFSRKINRPRFWQIMPFIMFSDSRNVRIGNPTIAPELSNIGEVNHLLPFLKGKASWLTSVYTRYTADVITSYATPLPTDTTILLNTFVNGSHEMTGGWENVLKIEPFQGFQFTLSGLLQYTNVALNAAQGGARNEGTNWEAKALVSYRFLKDWTIQLNGEYESPEITPQGRRMEQYYMDASLSHDFNKRLTGVVSVSDVFYTNRWGNILDTPYLYQENFRRREQRFIRFTLTWKFGEQNASIFRRNRNQQPQREPGGGGGGEGDF
jgi:hypothetical protein